MPIKQRCSKCNRLVNYGKLCPCGGRIGSSVILWAQINGKRYTKNLKVCTYAKAKKEEHEWILGLHEGRTEKPAMLSEVFDQYLRKLQSEGKPYLASAKLFCERMLAHWGDIQANALSVGRINEFKVYIREVGLSPAYCDRHIAIGKAAWNHYLPDIPNPFKRVKLYNPDNTLVRFLADEEVERLMEVIRNLDPRSCPLYDWVIIGINTGLRERNIMKLRAHEVDFQQRSITVTQKGGKKLTIAINQAVVDVLLPRVKAAGPAGWLWENPKTGKHYNWLRRSWATAKKRAGITRPFRFHDLRHHFGRSVLMATGNLRMTQLLMGHSSPVVTTRYVHYLLDEQRAAVDLLVKDKPESFENSLGVQEDADKILN